jgi:hypothetical protein
MSALLLRGPLTSLPPKHKPQGFGGGVGAPLLSPSPLEYPFRHFLSSSHYTEESVRALLEAELVGKERRRTCAYRIKVGGLRPFFSSGCESPFDGLVVFRYQGVGREE